MKQVILVLAANESADLVHTGRYFRVLTAPAGSVAVECASPAISAVVAPGQALQLSESFRSLRITNGATPQQITCIVGDGLFIDSTLTGNVQTQELAGATLATTAKQTTSAGVALQIAAAQATRKRLIICADINNTVPVMIGPSSVILTSGIPLDPGQSLDLETTAAVYAMSSVAASVYILEVRQ